MCSPAMRARQKEALLESLLRRKQLHELKCADLAGVAARKRVEARERVRAGDQAAARAKLLESKRAAAGAARCQRLVDMCESSAYTIDEDASTFQTVAVLTEVQRQHRPDARAVSRLDDALDGLRDLKETADDVQAALRDGTPMGGVDDAELEAELKALLEEDADEQALGLPASWAPRISAPPSAVRMAAPHALGLAELSEEPAALRRRGAPDGGPLPAV